MAETDELVFKKYKIIDVIKKDLKAADLKVTLFMTAYHSTKLQNDSLCSTNCISNHRCTLKMLQYIPGIPKLLCILRAPKIYIFDQLVFEILYWLMVVKCDPEITTVPVDSHKEILDLVRGNEARETNMLPDHIFKLNDRCSFEYSQFMEQRKAENYLKFGYQSVRLQDCFATIFCNRQFITRVKVSSIRRNLNEALKQSCFTKSWAGSMLGFNIKVIMLVQFIELNIKGTKFNCRNIFGGFNTFDDPVTKYSYLLVYKEKISKQSKAKIYATKLLIIVLLVGVLSFLIGMCYNKQCKFTF